MPFKFLAAFLLTVFTVFGFSFDEAQAQDKNEGAAFRVAVVDMEKVMAAAKAPQSIRSQINEKRKLFQAEIQKEEKDLREGNQELARQRTIMSPEAFKEERRKFEERFVAAQRKMQERKMTLDRARAAAMDKVSDALKQVITKIVKDNGITLLLRREQTVFTDKRLEVTQFVVTELDKLLPSVKVFTKGGAAK